MSDLCVIDHGEDERRALPSLRLCGSHYDRLRGDLGALPRLHEDLGRALGTGGTGTSGGRVSGSPTVPLPINPVVADHRDQIRHDLVWWCVYVSTERGVTLPANEVGEIAAWLGRHADWIAGSLPAAEECPPVIGGLVSRARSLLAPSGARRIEIGPCREVVDGQPCGGTLYATVRKEDDPRPSVIYCGGACGLEMGAESWRRFGQEYLRGERMAG